MDSMAERLENLLGDENTVAQLQHIIASLREGGGIPTPGPEQSSSMAAATGGAAPANILNGVMSLLPGLMSGGEGARDPNLALLQALRPFLSSKRKKRASEAMKLMKLLELLPMLQESGILGGFFGGEEDE